METNSIWKIAKRLKDTSSFDSKPIHGANGLNYNALDKANAIADCLEDQYKAHKADDDYRQHYRQVRRRVTNFSHSDVTTEYQDITVSETRRLIKKLKISKAPGSDKISNNNLKQLPVAIW